MALVGDRCANSDNGVRPQVGWPGQGGEIVTSTQTPGSTIPVGPDLVTRALALVDAGTTDMA
jgi:hypothetical protein